MQMNTKKQETDVVQSPAFWGVILILSVGIIPAPKEKDEGTFMDSMAALPHSGRKENEQREKLKASEEHIQR